MGRRIARRQVLTLILAAMVTIVVVSTVSGAQSSQAAWGETASVLVASGDLSPGSVIDESTTRTVRVPLSLAPRSAMSVTPSGRFTRQEIGAGEIITQHDIAGSDTNPLLASLPSDSRAVTISLGEAPPPLRNGDLVDVYAATLATLDSGFSEPLAVVVGHAATVLDATPTQATLGIADSDVEATVSASLGGGLSLVIVG